MIGKIIKWTLIGSFIATGIYICWLFYQIMSWDMPQSSKKELIADYQEKHTAIATLKRYFHSIVPDSVSVYIEFEEDDKVNLKVYKRPADPADPYPIVAYFEEWDINPYTYHSEADTADSYELYTYAQTLQLLHWNDDTFRQIKQYLDQANCISVTNGEPAQVGFRRSGLGMYFYKLFDQPLTDSLQKVYNDSCSHITV